MSKILVIGDSCIDRFVYGKCDRICPEAPIPIFEPIREITNKGMAGNVQANVISLGNECDVITNETTILKSRFVDERTHQMLMRLDENDRIDSSDKYVHDPERLEGYDAIIISDYDKGFLDENDIENILKAPTLTFLQTNKILGNWCYNASFIKINEYEYERTKHSIENVLDMPPLIVTLGDRGCEYNGRIYPIKHKVEVRDLSGAGDTFLAAFSVSYTKNFDMNMPIRVDESILFAQDCASKVVQEHGVVSI